MLLLDIVIVTMAHIEDKRKAVYMSKIHQATKKLHLRVACLMLSAQNCSYSDLLKCSAQVMFFYHFNKLWNVGVFCNTCPMG